MLTSSDFSLHPRLDADSVKVIDLPLSACLLAKDARWPWLILVPRIQGASELFDLSAEQQSIAMAEASRTGQVLKTLTQCKKINIAMIGNMVSQLHIHVVARSEGDPNWPGPIWGFGEREEYVPDNLLSLLTALREAMA